MNRRTASNTKAEGEQLVVSVPLAMKRRGGRKEIITPGGQTPESQLSSRMNASLALTIARAHRWRELLEQGRYRSIRSLALELGVDNSYVARLLRLTLLAPDMVEAILEGTEPSGLSLEKLYRAPMEWERQRQDLGAPGQSLAAVRAGAAGEPDGLSRQAQPPASTLLADPVAGAWQWRQDSRGAEGDASDLPSASHRTAVARTHTEEAGTCDGLIVSGWSSHPLREYSPVTV
jgi:hypothetical protein